MANITVTIKGREAIISTMQARLDDLKQQINEAIQGAGIDTAAMAKQNCPVDTGRLRSSIQYVPDTLKCQVGTNVNYAWFVELGTVKMASRPYLYPAFLKAVKGLKAELKALDV